MMKRHLDAYCHDGAFEEVSDLTEDEIYPVHVTSRGLVNLIQGDGPNRAPGEQGARALNQVLNSC